jgi:phage baseplate assembly protein W
MLPVLTTTPLTLTNRKVATSGLYQISLNDIVVLRLNPVSSGNGTPTVRTFIDWGDGSTSSSDYKSIGTQQQFQHLYQTLGPSSIKAQVQNTDGELSTLSANCVIATVVIALGALNSERPHKWAGLALPAKSIQQAYAASQNGSAPVFCGLSTDASVGSMTILVDSSESVFTAGSQLVITQTGKMVTAARVLSMSGNQVYLDSALLDNYLSSQSPVGATVELKPGSQSTRATILVAGAQAPWYFPVSYDADLIKASIRTILSTRQGERVMLYNFGTMLPDVPFEQNDQITLQLIITDLNTAIRTYEPRATVLGLTLNSIENSIVGTCSIQIADGSNSFDIEFALNQQQ